MRHSYVRNIRRETGGRVLTPFTTGNPFWGTKLLGLSIERDSGALKGLNLPVVVTTTPLRCRDACQGGGIKVYRFLARLFLMNDGVP